MARSLGHDTAEAARKLLYLVPRDITRKWTMPPHNWACIRSPHSRSREVRRFHTPAALRELLAHDWAARTAALRATPIDHPALRPYQRDAVAAVEQALQGGRRRMLLTMATGTGKTLTTIALLYRLLKAGVARRVLFLVDRRALAAQAVSAFGRFDAEPGLKFDRIYEVYSQRFRREDLDDDRFNPRVLPTSYLTNPEAGQAFVYVSTIQRLQINLFGPPAETNWSADAETEGAGQLDIPIHAFDVIVADECHRGYTGSEASRWREVLDHFDGIKIGLTATPATHTKAYFEDLVYTNSATGRSLVTAVASSTSGLYTLSVSKIQRVPIPLPPLAEQRRIVARVEALLAQADVIEREAAAVGGRRSAVEHAAHSGRDGSVAGATAE